MTFGLRLILAAILIVLQVYCATVFTGENWTPQFWFMFVLWLSSKPPGVPGLIIIGLSGLWLDGFSGDPMGTHAAVGLALYLLALQLTSRIQLRFVGLFVLGALGGLLTILLGVLVVQVSAGGDVGARLSAVFGPRITTMAVLLPIIFPLLNLLDRVTQRKPPLDRI